MIDCNYYLFSSQRLITVLDSASQDITSQNQLSSLNLTLLSVFVVSEDFFDNYFIFFN